ncbi:MAG: hypothetical protein E6J51_08870 [Chloroflexi bacterium]|nr:MAG: hypothetical protein E6J51_08870 [Chloroflexota bacterium]
MLGIGDVGSAVSRRGKIFGKKRVSTRKKAIILGGFCTAQLLDVTTTHIGLSQGRQELNGAAAWIIAHNGELGVSAPLRASKQCRLERLPDRGVDHDVCRDQQPLPNPELTAEARLGRRGPLD